MPEKPEGTNNPEKKPLPNHGQEASAVKPQDTDNIDKGEKAPQFQASQKLSETAWAPENQTVTAFAPTLPAGFPQPELVGDSIVEGRVLKSDEVRKSWDLDDQQIESLAKQIRECIDRRSFAGMGAPDPDTKQIARLLEGLKLSDRRAVEMVLNKKQDFRQELQTLLSQRPGDLNSLIAILDRPDRQDNLPLENTQAVHYAHKIVESLQGFSKEGADTTVNLLAPLNKAERQQIEAELSNELKMPFRNWLHQGALNNESIAQIEATLDHPDSGTDYKGSIKVLMGGLKDNWSSSKENAILHIVSGMDGKEIRDSGLFQELRSSQYLSTTAQQVLDVTLTGRDKWTADKQQSRELGEVALKAKNLEVFKDAMQSPAAREYFRTSEGSKKIDDTYSGPFDSRDKQIAHDYAELNDTKLLTDLQMYQFSLSPSREAITQRLMSATEDEKKLFQQGRGLADLRPKETEEEKAANRYYLDVFEALRSASKYDSKQLKEWTGMLLDTKSATKEEKTDPRQQILEMNKSGVSGLDAVRQLEDILKTNPELVTKLNGEDKELQAAFSSALKRVSEDARNAAIAGNMWKDMTDPSNLNPISAMLNAPERMRRQGELAQDITSSAEDKLSKQLLTQGQLSLEQKLFVAGDKKLSANDLLSLSADEKQHLLKGQLAPKLQEVVFGKGKESEFIHSILSKQDTKLTTLDQIRAFSLGRGASAEQIEALMDQMSVIQRKELSDQYFAKYQSVMHADILQQIKDPVDKARILQSLRHADDTAEQKIINTQIEQTKHSGPLDSLSEAYSPDQRMSSRYSRAAESFYRQVKDGLTDKQKDSLENLSPEKKQEIATALMKYQSSLKKYWSAQKDYTRNKEEMSEQLADATLTAGAVIASIAQPELTPALLARTAALSAAGRLGIKQAVMSGDFDTSQESFQKELYKGTMTGVLNSLGGQAFSSGRFVSLGKFSKVASTAGEKTVSELASNNALKSVLKDDAAQILEGKLEQTTMDKVFGSPKTCMNDAKAIAKSIAPKANDEQIDLIAKSIQQHRKQEVLNSFKGKLWHEGDQLATSITASVAGATFAEIASTAVGYESPTTLLKRLELSGQAAAVGGTLFHFGFKAVGKGVQGLTNVIIGKDAQGHLYAGPGTRVISDGKQIIVGKEPYYFKKDDVVVETAPRRRDCIDAPPFLEAASLPPKSEWIEPPDTTLEKQRPKTEIATPTPLEKSSRAFDKVPEDFRQQLRALNDEQLSLYEKQFEQTLPSTTDPVLKETVSQMLAYTRLLKNVRARVDGYITTKPKVESQPEIIEKPPEPKPEASFLGKLSEIVDTSDSELAARRTISGRTPAEIRQLAEACQLTEEDVRFAYASTSSDLAASIERYHNLAQKSPSERLQQAAKRLELFTSMVQEERIQRFQHRYPSILKTQIRSVAAKDFDELSKHRKMLDEIIKDNRYDRAVAYCKQEIGLVSELQAEHLSKTLDQNLSKRISSDQIPPVGEEIRLLWQYDLGSNRDGVNAIIGKPRAEAMTASRIGITMSRLSRADGVPKATGEPVLISDNLAAIPWRDGEILYSHNNEITVNDRIAKTSRTINSSGQLIECLHNNGELRQYTYDPTTNEVATIKYKQGTDVVTYEKHAGSFQMRTRHADGSESIEPLPTLKKIETNPDGSYTFDRDAVRTVTFPDGSQQFHYGEGRAVHHANIEVEAARLDKNSSDAFHEIGDTKLAEKTPNIVNKRIFRFSRLLTSFDAMAAETKMSLDDKAVFYKHLNRLMDDSKDQAIGSRAARRELAEQVLYNAVHARDIDQGQNNTCNVTTIEKRCWARHPVAMAQFAADIAEHGKFITTSGKVIDMSQVVDGLRPDAEARKNLRLQRDGHHNVLVMDGQRSWLSQMTQIAMVNTGWKEMSAIVSAEGIMNPPNIAFDRYGKVLGKIDPNDATKIYDGNNKVKRTWSSGDEVFDEHKQPLNLKQEDLVFDSKHQVIGILGRSKIEKLFDANNQVANSSLNPGDILYDAPGGNPVVRATQFGEIEYGKKFGKLDRQPGKPERQLDKKTPLTEQEVLLIKKPKAREYCKSERGNYINQPKMSLDHFKRISEEVTGIAEDQPFVVMRTRTKAESDIRIDITSKEELSEQLIKWKRDNKLPAIIYVNAAQPPFGQHMDASDATGIKHDWHVINAWDFDGTNVDITNQWGKKHNIKIPLEQLFDAMQDPNGRLGTE
ncbi:MAG: hypothetical protein K2Y22_03400 [Candidatus Obscuribacterales bacterium]|nr:hypothetical protein [Candidatus Obscuribacterales bacterium]